MPESLAVLAIDKLKSEREQFRKHCGREFWLYPCTMNRLRQDNDLPKILMDFSVFT